MKVSYSADECASAAAEFDRHEHRKDGERVVQKLTGSLDLLRDCLYLRIHRDVEQSVGFDSMLMPVSELKAERQTADEIEQYQVAEGAAAAVRHRIDDIVR